MSSYRLITSGKNQRREYLSLNRSPLFRSLPDQDFAQEQRISYYKFLYEKLPKLLNFYFPKEKGVEFSDYNNRVKVNVEEMEHQEPEISEEEARSDFLTWEHRTTFI